MAEAGHQTRNAQHAAAGKLRVTRSALDKPDTLVVLPNGQTLTLCVRAGVVPLQGSAHARPMQALQPLRPSPPPSLPPHPQPQARG